MNYLKNPICITTLNTLLLKKTSNNFCNIQASCTVHCTMFEKKK